MSGMNSAKKHVLQKLIMQIFTFTAVGNVTSTAEFNFFHDPEAAHIVLAKAQSHITLVPWEPCRAHGLSYVNFKLLKICIYCNLKFMFLHRNGERKFLARPVLNKLNS